MSARGHGAGTLCIERPRTARTARRDFDYRTLALDPAFADHPRLMQSKWSDAEARRYEQAYPDVPVDLALRVYTSRLIGADPDLVLHGGGNTSVKTTIRDATGQELRVLCVKGSGADLSVVEPWGLPAGELEPLFRLRGLEELSDAEVKTIRDVIDAEYQVEGDLRREVQMNIKRLMDIGCYRGLRHRRGLPVNGQRTRTNARTRKGPRRAIAGRKKAPRK